MGAERRSGRDRRLGIDRRETATGHLRNALQILKELEEAGPRSEVDRQAGYQSAMRRLWLALAELERRAR